MNNRAFVNTSTDNRRGFDRRVGDIEPSRFADANWYPLILKYGLITIATGLFLLIFTFIVIQIKVPVSLPGQAFYAYKYSDADRILHAAGTWVSDQYQAKDALQSSTLDCNKLRGYCIEATARIGPEEDILRPYVLVHDIAVWDDDELVTKPTETLCSSTTLKINIKTKKVVSTRTLLNTENSCDKPEWADATLQLEDGFKIKQELVKKASPLF